MSGARNNASDDGWIEWAGGECPVHPATFVQVRTRDGYETKRRLQAAQFTWDHVGGDTHDIIAYRVVQS